MRHNYTYMSEYSDNRIEVGLLRQRAELMPDGLRKLAYLASADLLECHDDTGISLDDWTAVRNLVEFCIERSIDENGV